MIDFFVCFVPLVKSDERQTNCLPVKPGSHMLPTYRGHRYGICEHLSPNHNLSEALTAGLPAKLR